MDYVIRATAGNGSVRAFSAVTTDLVCQAAKVHNLFPVASAALGRVMTAAALMSVDLKNKNDSVSIAVNGSGPLGTIVTVAKANGEIKGYVNNPSVDLQLNSAGKLDVGSAVGREGKLTIIRDLGLKEPYIGQVELVSGEIGDDIANYYWLSEQQPTAIALGVLVNPDLTVKAAGGYMIQLMPDADEHIINSIEQRISEIPPISALIDQGKTPEQVLEAILGDFDLKINAKSDIHFKCDCNRERLERVLLSLGKEELIDIIEKEGQADLVCHYCNTRYHFGRDELQALLDTQE